MNNKYLKLELKVKDLFFMVFCKQVENISLIATNNAMIKKLYDLIGLHTDIVITKEMIKKDAKILKNMISSNNSLTIIENIMNDNNAIAFELNPILKRSTVKYITINKLNKDDKYYTVEAEAIKHNIKGLNLELAAFKENDRYILTDTLNGVTLVTAKYKKDLLPTLKETIKKIGNEKFVDTYKKIVYYATEKVIDDNLIMNIETTTELKEEPKIVETKQENNTNKVSLDISELKEDIDNKYLKTKKVVSLLLNKYDNRITNTKEDINDTAIKDLIIDNKEVIAAKIDLQNYVMILTLGNEVTQPEEPKKEITLKENELQYLNDMINNEVIFKLYHSKVFKGIENIKMINKKNYIYITDETQNTMRLFIFANDAGLHYKRLNAVIEYFLANYTYKDLVELKEAYDNKEREKKEAISNKQEANKYILDDLYNYLGLHRLINNNVEVEYTKSKWDSKYRITFKLYKDSVSMQEFKIMLNEECNGLLLNNESINKEELKELVDTNFLKYQKIKRDAEVERLAQLQREKEEQRRYLAINNLYDEGTSNDKVLVIKYKNNYTAFERGVKFAVGHGKEGKRFRIDSNKFMQFINKKDTNKIEYRIFNSSKDLYEGYSSIVDQYNFAKLII